jgi:hypothetical protein
MFAIVEARLHVVLRNIIIDLTQTEINYLAVEVLDSVTGSMRVAGLRDHITRILRVANYDDAYQNEFAYAFSQLGEIHFVRDRIAHHGVSSFSATEFYTTNEATVREGNQEEMLIFTIDMLLDMAYDLNSLENYFHELDGAFLRMTGETPEWDQWILTRRPTWRYKPSSLRREGPKHLTSPRKPTRRHPPSPS